MTLGPGSSQGIQLPQCRRCVARMMAKPLVNQEGIPLARAIECPVYGERAASFRIRRVTDLWAVAGEFYHRMATCAALMTPDMRSAMDLCVCEGGGREID